MCQDYALTCIEVELWIAFLDLDNVLRLRTERLRLFHFLYCNWDETISGKGKSTEWNDNIVAISKVINSGTLDCLKDKITVKAIHLNDFYQTLENSVQPILV